MAAFHFATMYAILTRKNDTLTQPYFFITIA